MLRKPILQRQSCSVWKWGLVLSEVDIWETRLS